MMFSIEKSVRLEALLEILHEIQHETLLEMLAAILSEMHLPEDPLFSAQSAHNHESR